MMTALRTAALSTAVAVSLLLAGCTTGGADPETPSPSAPSESPSASPEPSPSTEPSEPAPEPEPTFGDLSEAQVGTIEAAISAGAYTSLGSFLGNPVKVTFAATEFSENRAPASAIADLDYLSGTTGWVWDLDEPTLASYRAGFYGSYFPENAIVGQSAETDVIALQVVGSEIVAIFICASANLLVE
jgi:hypothetical protein